MSLRTSSELTLGVFRGVCPNLRGRALWGRRPEDSWRFWWPANAFDCRYSNRRPLWARGHLREETWDSLLFAGRGVRTSLERPRIPTEHVDKAFRASQAKIRHMCQIRLHKVGCIKRTSKTTHPKDHRSVKTDEGSPLRRTGSEYRSVPPKPVDVLKTRP